MVNEKELLLVGIASSAGGLKPLRELIEAAICNKNMAYVVVPHLSRDYESNLPKILDRVTDLKIETIKDGLDIHPCHLYVLPPGFYARVVQNKFVLDVRPEKGPNKSADVLFESLASEYKNNAIGVVLSGSSVGADGSEGVCLIKENEGHTFAQDPKGAEFPQMRNLAISTGCIDSVQSANKIGQELSLVSFANS